nr:hypothetical protein [Tanacetum cinerariifolium]
VSPRLFCSGLKVYRLPPASSVASDASVMKLAIGQLVNGLSCHGSAMVIEDSDLEPKIDAMMREVLEISLRSFTVLPDGKN